MWHTLRLESSVYLRRKWCCSFWPLCCNSGSMQTFLQDACFHGNRAGRRVPGMTSESEKLRGEKGKGKREWVERGESCGNLHALWLSHNIWTQKVQKHNFLCQMQSCSLCLFLNVFGNTFAPSHMFTILNSFLSIIPVYHYTIVIYLTTTTFPFWSTVCWMFQ